MAETARIWGESDDVVEIDGDLMTEELYPETDAMVFTFGDGTKLEIRFTEDAEWRITVLERGAADVRIEEAYSPTAREFSEHSDVATLSGDLRSVEIEEID
jgi:hypothetical protein